MSATSVLVILATLFSFVIVPFNAHICPLREGEDAWLRDCLIVNKYIYCVPI